eukprot:4758489-Alexandrium_andersonii.AAC.1
MCIRDRDETRRTGRRRRAETGGFEPRRHTAPAHHPAGRPPRSSEQARQGKSSIRPGSKTAHAEEGAQARAEAK